MNIQEFLSHEIPVSRVQVETEEDSKTLGRSCGLYISLKTGRLDRLNRFEDVCACLVGQLRPLLEPYFGKPLCVCGIGNQDMPYDALGPETARRFRPKAYEALSLRSNFSQIAVVCPSVSALTNLSSETVISSVASAISAACILTIDACICKDVERLCSAIDLSDNGMRTYWATANLRQSTLGIPVVSIGVPTMIQAADLSAKGAIEPDVLFTPSGIVDVIPAAAFVIAAAITQVAYPELDYESVKQYIELFLHGII